MVSGGALFEECNNGTVPAFSSEGVDLPSGLLSAVFSDWFYMKAVVWR